MPSFVSRSRRCWFCSQWTEGDILSVQEMWGCGRVLGMSDESWAKLDGDRLRVEYVGTGSRRKLLLGRVFEVLWAEERRIEGLSEVMYQAELMAYSPRPGCNCKEGCATVGEAS